MEKQHTLPFSPGPFLLPACLLVLPRERDTHKAAVVLLLYRISCLRLLDWPVGSTTKTSWTAGIGGEGGDGENKVKGWSGALGLPRSGRGHEVRGEG